MPATLEDAWMDVLDVLLVRIVVQFYKIILIILVACSTNFMTLIVELIVSYLYLDKLRHRIMKWKNVHCKNNDRVKDAGTRWMWIAQHWSLFGNPWGGLCPSEDIFQQI